jgi:glycosyltransferase involved in cell wall biosynthesis
MAKISIITSLYKEDLFIEGFLRDITRQSAFHACELIIVAPDLSVYERDMIERYSHMYPHQIIVEEPKTDPGLYNCWNKAIELSSGEYITNANLDDRKHPDSILIHWHAIEEHPDIDLVYAYSLVTHEPNDTFESTEARDFFPCYDFRGLEGLLLHNSPHNNPMWRKTLHDKYGMFDGSYKCAADAEMWLRAVQHGSIFKKIDQILGLYYRNPKGVSSNPDTVNEMVEEVHQMRALYA